MSLEDAFKAILAATRQAGRIPGKGPKPAAGKRMAAASGGGDPSHSAQRPKSERGEKEALAARGGEEAAEGESSAGDTPPVR